MDSIAIISNNCWAGAWYQRHHLQYNTPFIGLFLFAADYIQLLENFAGYIDTPLTFTPTSKYGSFSYPVGKLKDIEIHFLHYDNAETAAAKWNRRCARLPRDPSRWLVKSDNRDGCTPEMMERFARLPFPHKISLSQSHFPYPAPRPGWKHIIIPDANVMFYETPFDTESYIRQIETDSRSL